MGTETFASKMYEKFCESVVRISRCWADMLGNYDSFAGLDEVDFEEQANQLQVPEEFLRVSLRRKAVFCINSRD